MAETTNKRAAPAGGALTGAPVLLKQGYMQQKGMMGYKKVLQSASFACSYTLKSAVKADAPTLSRSRSCLRVESLRVRDSAGATEEEHGPLS